MEDLKVTMEIVQDSLREIVERQKKELASDEEYQRQFYKLCVDIGVDPYAQKKGMFANLFKRDLNSFYRELGVRILTYCIKTRFQNGGLVRVSDIKAHLNKNASKRSERIHTNDIHIAVEKLKPLSPSLKFFDAAANDGERVEYLQSSETDFTADAMRVLTRAQFFDGKLTHSQVGIEDKWKRELMNFAEKGLAWVDIHQGESTYYFPGIYFQKSHSEE